jgi:hypothetical protein
MHKSLKIMGPNGPVTVPAVVIPLTAASMMLRLASPRAWSACGRSVRPGPGPGLNPQPLVATMLDLLCAEEMFSIRRLADAPHPDASADGG